MTPPARAGTAPVSLPPPPGTAPVSPPPPPGVAPPGAAPVSPGVVVRPPVPDDGDALSALVAACDRGHLGWAPAGWMPPEVGTDWSARLSEPGRWSEVAFAGELVAFVSFRPARSEETPGTAAGPELPGVAHLAALYVHPVRRRQGLGTAMLARAEAAMRSRGCRAGRLWTPAGAPAERFYAARGWRRDGRSGWDGWLGLAMAGYAKRL